MFELIKLQAEDAPLYSSLVFNETVMTMNMGRVFTKEEAASFFCAILDMNKQDGLVGYYKVLRDGVFIGIFGISQNEDSVFEVEYMLLPAFWGQGYATQLVMEQVALISRYNSAEKIIAITDPMNIGSIKVLQRNGFAKIKDFTNTDGDTASLYGLILC